MLMIENHISGNLYNELLSKSSEEKCMAFQSMAWSKDFLPGLSLCILYFIFHKGENTFDSSAKHLSLCHKQPPDVFCTKRYS